MGRPRRRITSALASVLVVSIVVRVADLIISPLLPLIMVCSATVAIILVALGGR
jgi:hypothetical protein